MVSPSNHEPPARRDAWVAALAYTALTLIYTWPLAAGLTRDFPGDLGDPLLNAWIVAWDTSHLGRGLWNANIYFPHPLTLAYSEHLLAQAVQVLPIHVFSSNPILSYNLLFLSTFVLSGLGAFLLTRELTGNRAAAFVAGAAYAFAPFRIPSIPHLQVLSSQWMPFTLYGFRRYFDNIECRGRASARPWAGLKANPYTSMLPLVGGSVAWILQNLSCGYYLLYFSPIAAAYLAWEMSVRSLWRRRDVLLAVLTACVAVVLITGAFMVPYFELRRLGFAPRSLTETIKYSADVYGYLTADPKLRLWGRILQVWWRPEGTVFPGFTTVALAIAAIVLTKTGRVPALVLLLATVSFAVLTALLGGWVIQFPGVRIASFPRAFFVVCAVSILILVFSQTTRQTLRRWLATPAGFFALMALYAVVMSWGPEIQAKSRTVSPSSLYALFYDWVPGYDGLRVAARFAMVVAFALAILAGLGVAALARKVRGTWLATAAVLAILIESIAAPLQVNENGNGTDNQPGLAPLPRSVAETPPVYGFVSRLPESATLLELPLGEPPCDARYMLHSTTHWRRLVNGYSGGAPRSYERLNALLQDVLNRPDFAWEAASGSGATHVIVHEAFYAGDRGARISDWLRAHGAKELASFGADRIFQMP